MITSLIRKLENYQQLTPQEISILEESVSEAVPVERDEDVIKQGETPKKVYLVVDGWACRYRVNSHGKLQILNYLIPGDLANLHTTLARQIDHSICALVPSKIASITHDRLYSIYGSHPRLARSLSWMSLIEISILQEWLVNLGMRPADQRLAHLLCELLVRSRAAGLTEDHRFHLPLTQIQLGEAMGITHVHTNRVVQKLRADGLITLNDRMLSIIDWQGMKRFADFDAIYLHLERANPELAKDL